MITDRMAPGRARGPAGDGAGTLRDTGGDAMRLVIDYARQETLGSLRGTGRFLAFGVAGSLLVTVGAVLVLLAVLRLLQSETGAFAGNLSWLPYVIVALLGLAVGGLAAWRITQGPGARRSRPGGGP